MIRVVVVVAAVLLASATSRAQVAVSTSIAADDPAQRDIAGRVVSRARATWQVATLQNVDAKDCKPGDTECLRHRAAERGNSHLLVVGVAPLGVRDHVLVVQLYDVTSATPLFDQNAVQPGGDFDKKQLDKLAGDLVKVSGPPLRLPDEAPLPEAPTVRPAGTLSVIGAGLVVVGAVAALATVAVATLYGRSHDPLGAGDVAVVGASVSGGRMSAGAVARVVDAL